MARLYCRASLTWALVAAAWPSAGVCVVTIAPAFSGSYTATDIGGTGTPSPHGGLTFLPGDPNHILIGSNPNAISGVFYKLPVPRNASCHIPDFVSGVVYGTIGEYNDAGVTFGPEHVLFSTRYPRNELAQTRIASADENRIDDLDAHGIVEEPSVTGAAFVPGGFAGAGQFKLISIDGNWYTLPLTPDGTGTFTPGTGSFHATLVGSPEGIAYVGGSNAVFGADSVIVAENFANVLSTYTLDPDGNPVVASRRPFASGLNSPEGLAVDPLTGDLLISSIAGSSIIRISGFVVPRAPEMLFTDGFDDLCQGALELL